MCGLIEGMVDEVVNAYAVALKALGHQVTIGRGEFRVDALNVVMFSTGCDPEMLRQHQIRYLVANYEHLSLESLNQYPGYIKLLQSAFVWDYSKSNLKLYGKLNIPSGYYCPLGYEESADENWTIADNIPGADRDIDVLMFGTLNQRRFDTVERLRARGLKVVTNENQVWSTVERDGYIRRSKLVLNMHQYCDTRIVEAARLMLLLRRRKAVLAELYSNSEIDEHIRNAVFGTSYEKIPDMVELLVHSPELRSLYEQSSAIHIGKIRSMQKNVADALVAFNNWMGSTDRLTVYYEAR